MEKDEQLVYDMLIEHRPKGADADLLLKQLPHLSQQDLMFIINSLLKKHFIDLKKWGETVFYKAKDIEEVRKTADLDQFCRMVYNLIKDSETNGIWIKDIKTKSNLHTQLVNSSIKTLEKKNLIKSLKSVRNPTKKMYILTEFEPSQEVTGGAWYTDQEFDFAFVEGVANAIFDFIRDQTYPRNKKDTIYPANHKFPTARDIHKFVTTSGIVVNVELSLDEVCQILKRLEHDGKIYSRLSVNEAIGQKRTINSLERKSKKPKAAIVIDSDDERDQIEASEQMSIVYIAVRKHREQSALAQVPCGACPVHDFCSIGGPVNPSNCVYFDQWF